MDIIKVLNIVQPLF